MSSRASDVVYAIKALRSRRAVRGVIFGALFLATSSNLVGFYFQSSPSNLWLDAHIYFQATQAWLAGGSPWAVSWQGIGFGAPPPSLLLNLPLIPLGENGAVVFWILANSTAVIFLLRRFALGWYWIFFYPIAEGFLAGSPDVSLAALAVLGAGVPAVVTKPYSAPAIATRGWRSIAIGAALIVATVPFLPWLDFINALPGIRALFQDHTLMVPAFGNAPLMIAAVLSLFVIGGREALFLLTPALLAQQPHYLVFSLEAIVASVLLTVASTVPVEHAAAIGIILYALATYWRRYAIRRAAAVRVEAEVTAGQPQPRRGSTE